MCFEPRDYLRHILTEADYLINQGAGLIEGRFMADETLQRAFVRSLEIVVRRGFPGRPRASSRGRSGN
jgi:uncharacterized protein with HEPN domain